MKPLPNSKLLFYDGECAFCTRWVAEVIRADETHRIRFGPKQGKTFQSWVTSHPEVADVDSLVLMIRAFDGTETVYVRSSAVRLLIKGMPEFQWLRLALWVSPVWLADIGYKIFSKLRAPLFGKNANHPAHLEGQLGYVG